MTWIIDASHSTVTFSVRHMMISKVRGRFSRFDGTVNFDEQNPANSSVTVTIDATSIDIHDKRRDGHLMSPDFLNVANYPTITFASKRVEIIDETHGRIIGDLTIHGVTREVTLEVEYNGQSKSPWGTISAGFSISTKINRKDWGLTWNVTLETDGVLGGDEVTIEIVKQVPQEESVAA